MEALEQEDARRRTASSRERAQGERLGALEPLWMEAMVEARPRGRCVRVVSNLSEQADVASVAGAKGDAQRGRDEPRTAAGSMDGCSWWGGKADIFLLLSSPFMVADCTSCYSEEGIALARRARERRCACTRPNVSDAKVGVELSSDENGCGPPACAVLDSCGRRSDSSTLSPAVQHAAPVSGEDVVEGCVAPLSPSPRSLPLPLPLRHASRDRQPARGPVRPADGHGILDCSARRAPAVPTK